MAIAFWIVFIVFFANYLSESPSSSDLPAYDTDPSANAVESAPITESDSPSYVKPIDAPNGKKWPQDAAYIDGYPIGRADGLSKLTIDNSANETDMFVKLVAIDSNKSLPIRHVYIPAQDKFTMNKIRAGQYDIRYQDLSDGTLSRSEEFFIEEISTEDGVKYSVNTMTLFKVSNGNFQTYPLSPDEF